MIQCRPANVSTRTSLMDGMCLYVRVSSVYVIFVHHHIMVIYVCVRESKSLNMSQCLSDSISTRISLMDGMCLYVCVSSLYVCVCDMVI